MHFTLKSTAAWLAVILVLVLFAFAGAACTREKIVEVPKEVKVVTIPPPDPAPNGCASCHKKEGANDYTLAAEVKKVANHPAVPADATVNTCVTCHKSTAAVGAKPPNLGRALHPVHLGSKNFTESLKGYCNACHILDTKTGDISVKGLTAAKAP